ncbi:unnamed protein product [Ectocarpus sp. 12 AP-2014]
MKAPFFFRESKHRQNLCSLPPSEYSRDQQEHREERGNRAYSWYPNGRILQTERRLGSLGYVRPRAISRPLGFSRIACSRRDLRRQRHGPRENCSG